MTIADHRRGEMHFAKKQAVGRMTNRSAGESRSAGERGNGVRRRYCGGDCAVKAAGRGGTVTERSSGAAATVQVLSGCRV